MELLHSFKVTENYEYYTQNGEGINEDKISNIREYEYDDYGIKKGVKTTEITIGLYADDFPMNQQNRKPKRLVLKFSPYKLDEFDLSKAITCLLEEFESNIEFEAKKDGYGGFDVTYSFNGKLKELYDYFELNVIENNIAIIEKATKNHCKYLGRTYETKAVLDKWLIESKNKTKSTNKFIMKNELVYQKYTANIHSFFAKFGMTNPKNHKLKALFYYGITIKKDVTMKQFREVFTTYTSDAQALNELKNTSLEKQFPLMVLEQIDEVYNEMKSLFDEIMTFYHANVGIAPNILNIINKR